MNNAQIIFNESIELMKNGIIGTTGRQITIEYEKDWKWEDEPKTLKKCTDLINELVKTGVKSANIGG